MNDDTLVLKIFQELMRLDTINPPGSEKLVADYLFRVFSQAGIPCEVQPLGGGRANFVAWIGGGGPVPSPEQRWAAYRPRSRSGPPASSASWWKRGQRPSSWAREAWSRPTPWMNLSPASSFCKRWPATARWPARCWARSRFETASMAPCPFMKRTRKTPPFWLTKGGVRGML